jgi:signal transduction histidine kinase
LDVLRERTTAIRVRLIEKGKSLETTLEDRGELIYRIREKNEYESLEATAFKSDIYFLNRSAKATFARRMGLPSVQFGAIFLFRNGFRVFPIGSEQDDFFGLNRRKQQGQRRFLGGRDLIGRVDIRGTPNFNEATSRNQGLIRNEHVEQLIRCVIEKCVRRLERYVVDISWKDDFDTDVVDTSRMLLDESSARISELVSKLAASKGVELIEYNSSLVRIVDEKSSEFETSLRALEILAEKTGDKRLLRRIKGAQERIKALQDAEAEAREAGMRAEQRALAAEGSAAVAEAKYADEVQRNDFLVAAASLDEDTILNLHHQIIIHAADVHHKIQSMMGKLRGSADIPRKDWIDLLEKISYRNSQILTAARFATKGGYKQQSAEVESDLAIYIQDYVQTVSLLWAPQGILPEITNDASGFVRRFKPIEVGIVVDNLVSNSSKARATSVGFFLSRPRKTELEILVADDGAGWAQDLSHLERIFEKGTTTSNGSGLGLYHVRQVIESMGGTIEARKEAYSERFDGACLVIRLPK